MPVATPTNFATGSVSSGATCSTESKTPSASAVYVVFVHQGNLAGAGAAPTLAGWGITWNSIQTQLSNDGDYRQTAFWGRHASPSTGVLTATCGGGMDRGISVRVQEWTGADLSAPVGANKDTSVIGSSVNTIAGTLAAITAGNGVAVAVMLDGSSGGYTPGEDVDTVGSGLTSGVLNSWTGCSLIGQAAPSVSWVTSRHPVLSCFEVIAAAGGGTVSATAAVAAFTVPAVTAHLTALATPAHATFGIASPSVGTEGTQILRPMQDITTTGWSSTGSTFYGALNEVQVNDATYVTSPDEGTDPLEVKLTPAQTPPGGSTGTLRLRLTLLE